MHINCRVALARGKEVLKNRAKQKTDLAVIVHGAFIAHADSGTSMRAKK
jgi:hypothetical protein